ncbi:MAG: peptidylprolyl isomerase [Sphingobacterium sp.]
MRIFIAIITFILILASSSAQTHKLEFTTSYGTFKVLLYDFTPNHRDLILSSLKDSLYRGALFNRIIEGFVIQGGDHDFDIAKYEAEHTELGKPRLAAEFNTRAFHKIGALGAGRDNNNEKASFLKQIYFVVGNRVTNEQLDSLEQIKGVKYTSEQRRTYLNIGGQPRLDKDFTVFGEVYQGLDILLEISKVKTDAKDFPTQKIPFTFKVINDEIPFAN